MKYTSRERIKCVLSHNTPDRIPIDLGSTSVSTINMAAYKRLKNYLDVKTPDIVLSRKSGTAKIDEMILDRFNVDTRMIRPKSAKNFRTKELSDGSFIDEWGVTWAPTGVGTYHVRVSPLSHITGKNDLDGYHWPEVYELVDLDGFKEETEKLHRNSRFALVLNLPGGIIHFSQFLRGYENWLIDLVENPVLVEALFDKVLSVWIKITEALLDEVGKYVDIVYWGDDIAFQNSTIVSVDMYRKLIKPWQKTMFDFVKSKTEAYILYHSCGAVYSFIKDLIEIGVDALNPIQVSAKDMDTFRLKKEFGSDLAFWGAIDTHYVLSRGKPDEVKKEVKKRIEDLSKNGGYVVAPVHNIQSEVPPENICAMFEVIQEWEKC